MTVALFPRSLVGFLFPATVFGLVTASAANLQTAAPKVDFVRDVAPILRGRCAQCHSAQQKQGGLCLDTRADMLRGGANGPALAPGNSARSLIVRRVLGEGGKPQMPLGFGALAPRQIDQIRAWIDQGGIWPGRSSAHWAYVAPIAPSIPTVKNRAWVRNPIDAFILANLEKRALSPSAPADRVTLIRRVTLDLTGLPPSPSEVDEYIADRSPHAYERVVDRLLASPHYGERMALPWLDAARYADSNGFQQDGDTYQYVWRDWVIKSLNSNMPFDQFTVQQLAGDLLPNASVDEKIATGFNRCGMLNGEGGAIAEEQRNNILFDRVDVTATAFMGVTLACAQCHDHKYDPFTQRDYYSFMAFFNNVPESGVPPGGGQYRIADPWILVGSPGDMTRLSELDSKIATAEAAAKAAAATARPAADALVAALKKHHDDLRNTVPRVMIMSEAQPRVTHILERGSYLSPAAQVVAETPGCLPAMPAQAPRNRLGLAQWLVSPQNPLTARVQVNRYWQLFFGLGLVKTSENLGVQCDPPEYPKLLDWLAVRFRSSGWNVKELHRLIVTSATYRQSSRVSPEMQRRDPENRLLARGARFRMSSLVLRDVALATSGLINLSLGGKPVYPYQPKGIWDGLAITHERDFTYPQSTGKDLYRRSIYTFWRRTVAPANMFDTSVRNTCKVRQPVTSTPLYALTTLNDVTWVEAARALAQNVMLTSISTPQARISEAFRRICARRPGPAELVILMRSFNRALTYFKQNPSSAAAFLKMGDSPRDITLDAAVHSTLATVCLAIYNLDEALTRE